MVLIRVLLIILITISFKTLGTNNLRANSKISNKFLIVKNFDVGILGKNIFFNKYKTPLSAIWIKLSHICIRQVLAVDLNIFLSNQQTAEGEKTDLVSSG